MKRKLRNKKVKGKTKKKMASSKSIRNDTFLRICINCIHHKRCDKEPVGSMRQYTEWCTYFEPDYEKLIKKNKVVPLLSDNKAKSKNEKLIDSAAVVNKQIKKTTLEVEKILSSSNDELVSKTDEPKHKTPIATTDNITNTTGDNNNDNVIMEKDSK